MINTRLGGKYEVPATVNSKGENNTRAVAGAFTLVRERHEGANHLSKTSASLMLHT